MLVLTLDLVMSVKQLLWEKVYPLFRRQRNNATLHQHLSTNLASSLKQGFLFIAILCILPPVKNILLGSTHRKKEIIV